MNAQPPVVMRIESLIGVRQWQAMGRLLPSALDRRDGFIHLSPPEEVTETIARYFEPESGIVCAEIATSLIEGDLRYEHVDGRARPMPHLYAPHISWEAVKRVWRVEFTEGGVSLGGPLTMEQLIGP